MSAGATSGGANFDGVVVETGATPVGTVIWLHGLGADAHDFESLVPHLGVPAYAPLRFVFPNAPTQPVTINGGMRMRAWYDILELSLQRRVDEAGIRRTAVSLEGLIAREKARGMPANRIVLAGFSQGGAMALTVGLRHAETLAGILVLSAYDPMPEHLAEAHAANRQTPVFFAHGLFDMVVPVAAGRLAHDRLVDAGHPAELRTYPTQHNVHPDEVRDIGDWLRARLP